MCFAAIRTVADGAPVATTLPTASSRVPPDRQVRRHGQGAQRAVRLEMRGGRAFQWQLRRQGTDSVGGDLGNVERRIEAVAVERCARGRRNASDVSIECPADAESGPRL